MIQKHSPSFFFHGFLWAKTTLLILFFFSIFSFFFTKHNFHSTIFAFDITERAANASVKWQRCKKNFIIIKTPAHKHGTDNIGIGYCCWCWCWWCPNLAIDKETICAYNKTINGIPFRKLIRNARSIHIAIWLLKFKEKLVINSTDE